MASGKFLLQLNYSFQGLRPVRVEPTRGAKVTMQKLQKANGAMVSAYGQVSGGYRLSREPKLLAAAQIQPHQPLAAMLGDTGLSMSLPTRKGQDTDLQVMESAAAFNLDLLSLNNS